MSSIFISYRRQDSAGFTRAMEQDLSARYGSESIFRDLEDIDAGDNFVNKIQEAVSSCKVLIAVIGPHWSTMTNRQGERRLDNPEDFVRVEIETALKRRVPVIPVTVKGAQWPPAEALPESLQPILQRKAHDLSDRQGRWDYDLHQLMARLDRIDGIKPQQSISARETGWRKSKTMSGPKYLLALGMLIIVIIGLFHFLPEERAETDQSSAGSGAGTTVNKEAGTQSDPHTDKETE